MTERMLELARQAGLKKDHGSDREYLGDFDWREFTELIVRECAKLIDQDWHISGAELKEHFGLEVKNE